jgi:hypothetical protein
MTNLSQYLFHLPRPSIDDFSFFVKVYAVALSLLSLALSTRKLKHLWRTRNLRRVWGIKDGDYVAVVCSELEKPEERQHVEPREFIYSLKYGDVDAFFEIIVTLLRLFPKIKLQICSSGEAEKMRMDLSRHLILIGGPDYNLITERILDKEITQISYRSPYLDDKSSSCPEEIVIYETATNREYCERNDERDYGYIERIRNPHNPKSNIILIGGCHTIGVTCAAKAFSMAESERGEMPSIVLENAQKVAKKISRNSEFVVLIRGERVGQTLSTPIVEDNKIMLKTTV